MNFATDLRAREDEDLIQTAWLKALEKTDHRPSATTRMELDEKYKHIMGLVIYIYRHEKTNARRKKPTLPLTDDYAIEYTDYSLDLDGCTPVQREAIDYYLELVQQREPIRPAQRMKLGRLRKKSGLKLDLNY